TIEISALKRRFIYNGVALPDVDGMSAEQVRDLYAAQYPELISCEIQPGAVENGTQEFRFVRAVGTKG
ncbi:MAG TPA: PRTRC system protein C, partial [Burkholderiaceae bacterium]|nr:PRTRC system protein C [Burkholderiaceae bacterium]